jgi:hypothetical protein
MADAPGTGPDAFVAVFDDPRTVDRVRDVLESGGVEPQRIVVGDHRASLEAEMQSEEDRAVGGALIGVFLTGEQTAGALAIGGILTAIGAVIGALVGLFVFGALGAWYWRVLGGAVVGALMLGTVGLVIGGGFAAEEEPPAAQSGTTIEIDDTSTRTRELLLAQQPTRLDEFHDGELVRTLVDHRPGLFRRLGRGLADPSRRG